jgi:hypothetical protein
MIDELLDSRQISPKEFKLYKLFTSELGGECLKTMVDELFWEEPQEEYFTEAHFAFYDGRRSIVRGIKSVVDKVQTLINKQLTPEDTNVRPTIAEF